MSVLSQCYSIIIDRDISAPGHGKEVVDGIHDVDKRYIYQFMSKFQLPVSVRFDSKIKMHTGTVKEYVSLAKEFQDHLEKEHRKNGAIDRGKSKNDSWKENGQKESIIFRIMLLLNSNV